MIRCNVVKCDVVGVQRICETSRKKGVRSGGRCHWSLGTGVRNNGAGGDKIENKRKSCCSFGVVNVLARTFSIGKWDKWCRAPARYVTAAHETASRLRIQTSTTSCDPLNDGKSGVGLKIDNFVRTSCNGVNCKAGVICA